MDDHRISGSASDTAVLHESAVVERAHETNGAGAVALCAGYSSLVLDNAVVFRPGDYRPDISAYGREM